MTRFSVILLPVGRDRLIGRIVMIEGFGILDPPFGIQNTFYVDETSYFIAVFQFHF